MILTCPECSAKFVVKSEAIGPKGRKVKCAKCAHKWFQDPDPEVAKAAEAAGIQEEPKETEAIPEGGNVPAPVAGAVPLHLKLSALASGVVFLFALLIISANSVLPTMSGLFGLFGIHDATQIALYDVEVKTVEEGKYNDLLVTGKIVNESDSERYLPDLRLKVLDENGDDVKLIMLESGGTMMEAGEKIDFENKIPRIPKTSTVVVMDIGNKLDLSSR